MFTLHPATGDSRYIVIESSWGLGEAVVGGKVTPDEIVIEKSTLRIVEKRVSHKILKYVYNSQKNANEEVDLSNSPEADKISISDEEAIELAKLALKIEEHYKRPMDIEWAIDADLKFPDNVFIVQARPETFWSSKKATKEEKEVTSVENRKVLVKGLAASPGIASGIARVILDVKEAGNFKKGDILVTRMTDPDWVPIMKIASAIVTDEGGITSHAAIVSRELGIPAIVGTKEATKVIKDGRIVEEVEEQKPQVSQGISGISRDTLMSLYPITATKIYMNLGQPDVIDKYVDLPFDGIGLMRL
jgi:pyruvate,water dikinase